MPSCSLGTRQLRALLHLWLQYCAHVRLPQLPEDPTGSDRSESPAALLCVGPGLQRAARPVQTWPLPMCSGLGLAQLLL